MKSNRVHLPGDCGWEELDEQSWLHRLPMTLKHYLIDRINQSRAGRWRPSERWEGTQPPYRSSRVNLQNQAREC